MFVLTSIKQTVRVPAEKFHLNLYQAIEQELNQKYANKVVLNVGLCIALWDLTNREDSYILPGDGASHTKVSFRCAVFRPFMDEILVGKIKNASSESVQISLGFFDDIIIPADNLQYPSKFCEKLQTWVWEVEVDGDKHELPMEKDSEIRFRVVAETFTDTSPSGPNSESSDSHLDVKENKQIPYLITASINEPGLGPLAWWEKSE